MKRNLLGHRFHKLLVIAPAENKDNKTQWLCRCDCGKSKTVASSYLVSGTTKSCGCMVKEIAQQTKLHNLTGQRFGLLTVQNQAIGTKVVSWECLCDCGKVTIVRAGNLRSKTIKSCGCLVTRQGNEHPAWTGGKTLKDGYVTVSVQQEGKWKRVLEHRYIMELSLGRRLLPNENVHHINGNKADNHIENLELWVKVQPCGQRATDIVNNAVQILKLYAPELLCT